MSNWLKVHFQLVQDEDGYPPVGVENLWVDPGEAEGQYVVSNTPFFVRDVTLGDIIAVREDEGHLWFDRVIQESDNSLIRVVAFERADVDGICKHLQRLGCCVEYERAHNLIAVNIPGDVPLATVQEYLLREARAERIDYEEPILRQD